MTTGYFPVPECIFWTKYIVYFRQKNGLGYFWVYLIHFLYLYENEMKFLSIENLLKSYKKAVKKRKEKTEVYIFNQEQEKNLKKILEDLRNRKYKHWKYRLLVLNDSKKRYIYSPQLRDHILHHMIYNVLYSVLDKKIPYNSFATRIGKWWHQWLKYFFQKSQKLLKYYDFEKIYFMKIDISKYFYSIHHNLLKQKIFKYIKNQDLVYAINLVIDSYKTSNIFDELFEKNSFYRNTIYKGVPIWAIYSQLFANFYLYDLDRYINQYLKPMIYLRYMDDMIFVSNSVENINFIKKQVLSYIYKLKLYVAPRKIQINKMYHWLNVI